MRLQVLHRRHWRDVSWCALLVRVARRPAQGIRVHACSKEKERLDDCTMVTLVSTIVSRTALLPTVLYAVFQRRTPLTGVGVEWKWTYQSQDLTRVLSPSKIYHDIIYSWYQNTCQTERTKAALKRVRAGACAAE